MENLLNQDTIFELLPVNSKQMLIYLDNDMYFHNWFFKNTDKIRNKFKGLSNKEEIEDVIGELICASMFIKSDEVLDLIYEPLGTKKRAPDFKVSLINDQEFYCEVRRIRRNFTEVNRDNFINIFLVKIKQINRNFGINLYCNDLEVAGFDENQIYETLINKIDEIVKRIEKELALLDEEQENTRINLDMFAQGLYISVHKIPINNRINRVKYYGSAYNCPMTQKEFTKFGDIIFEKLPQLVDGSPNLVFVITDNDSHWFEDLEDALSSIRDLVNSGNDLYFTNKGYSDANDFTNQFRKLSNIFVLSSPMRGKLWTNLDASYKINEKIRVYLEKCS